ncbi:AI-2E family transporter [Lichenifustis flavocetrariae]|uniref:AI-2E family transporter n=1 Tax=Lichenifustis flavocetrariae TaxID=2949735 RepID=A0AA41YV70_9HYPH|nr:AI-2E family transporter [Lichenifustis flavocetrariae]MCW6507920.1 AI-2E family transporter [Lichenifustis flavocetrariae]
MARVNASIPPAERDGTRTVITVGAVIAALYFGREIFVPIALAILLSFVLAPAVRKLHAVGLGRVFPVMFATLTAFAVIATLAAVMAAQLRDVAADLPRYEDTVTKKVTSLRGATSGGALQKIEDAVTRVNGALNKEPRAQASVNAGQAQSPEEAPAARAPIQVEVQKPVSSFDTLSAVVSPLLHPLGTGGIVVIFVIFILLQREDLRNRLIRLFGASDLHRTTAAIDDGAKRLSRYLLIQSLLNATTGLLIGVAAFAIGVPNPILWGILFGCMRFVPYLGPIIGGALPCLFAAAVDPGWSMALWMAGTVVVLELLVGQFLEPLLYGHNTGLSPVAVVVSATFWTVLWGPIGLLLATPLTVCLVVIGRHVDQLEFLDVLLGDRPPLSAPETFYQRMLANDPTEVSDQAQECLKSMSLTDYYDSVVLPGLLLAQGDVATERLSVDRQIQIRDATAEVIEDLNDQDEPAEGAGQQRLRRLLGARETDDHGASETLDEVPVPAAWQQGGAVLCIGGRGPLDDCAASILAQVLSERGMGARAESYAALSKGSIGQLDVASARLICLSCLDGTSSAYLRFAIRRIRRHAPRAKIMIGAWWLQTAEEGGSQPAQAPASLVDPFATTIVDAVRFCLAEASALPDEELSSVADMQPDLAAAS